MMNEQKVPQLRFSGFGDEWEEKKLGDVSDRVTRKNENLESKLPLTISAQYGLVDQITFFNNQIASVANLKNYFLLEKGEFAYNKSYSAGYPWGAIKRLDRYDKGVLSTLYIVFKPKKINSDYLVSYYDTTNWHKQVSEIAAEGARNHGLLNIAPNDFFQTTFFAPKSENEQQKIGTMLSKIDSLIQAKTQKLESLKSVKKSLLQKCFPKDGKKVPEMRFGCFSEDWEENKLKDLSENITVGIANSATHAYCENGVVMFRNQNIKPNFLDDDDLIYIDRKFEERYKTKRLKENDILVARTGYPGTACVVPKKYENAQTFTTLILRLGRKDLDSFYVTQYMNSPYGIAYFSATQIGGGQKNSGAGILSEMVLKYPSIDEQRKIGQFFSKFDSLISLQQKEIENLTTIKKSLLQKMFV